LASLFAVIEGPSTKVLDRKIKDRKVKGLSEAWVRFPAALFAGLHFSSQESSAMNRNHYQDPSSRATFGFILLTLPLVRAGLVPAQAQTPTGLHTVMQTTDAFAAKSDTQVTAARPKEVAGAMAVSIATPGRNPRRTCHEADEVHGKPRASHERCRARGSGSTPSF
jgi:hypothetical protein